MKQQSLSYDEISRMRPEKLERLAMKGLLNDATLALRCSSRSLLRPH
jgi:hypothetical protein